MHLVTIPEPLIANDRVLYLDGRYLMEDRIAAELMLLFPNTKIVMDHYNHSKYAISRPNALTEHILVAGGIQMGDAIMLTPVLRALKAKFPKATLHVACNAHNRQALQNLPYIDGFEEWPLRYENSENYDSLYFVEGFMDHPLARTHHLTDVFAAMCNVTVTDYTADYKVTDDEQSWAWETFPRVEGRKRLGLQVRASVECRTYPKEQLAEIIRVFAQDGWDVYLMGTPHEYVCKEMNHLYDARIKAPGFRESSAFLLTCDAFVGPDSGFLHVAGALKVPAVGLFSVFPHKLRTAHYPTVFAIQGAGDCAPCFHQTNRLTPRFPRHGLCSKAILLPGQERRCEVLAEITPERIKQKVEQLILKPALA